MILNVGTFDTRDIGFLHFLVIETFFMAFYSVVRRKQNFYWFGFRHVLISDVQALNIGLKWFRFQTTVWSQLSEIRTICFRFQTIGTKPNIRFGPTWLKSKRSVLFKPENNGSVSEIERLGLDFGLKPVWNQFQTGFIWILDVLSHL